MHITLLLTHTQRERETERDYATQTSREKELAKDAAAGGKDKYKLPGQVLDSYTASCFVGHSVVHHNNSNENNNNENFSSNYCPCIIFIIAAAAVGSVGCEAELISAP